MEIYAKNGRATGSPVQLFGYFGNFIHTAIIFITYLRLLRHRAVFAGNSIQTISDLLGGVAVDMPSQHGTFKQAERYKSTDGMSQRELI
ncbi:MAG: hypothetical protein OXG60_12915 [Chloroflexi bacterium]|nr:hypothetical protein [Chloroflexota bacterium]